MNPLQSTIDFSQVNHRENFDHGTENNAQSDAHYDANLSRFNGQCRDILARLQRGERLTTFSAMEYGIGDLRARIRDIRKHIPVQDEFVKDASGKRTRFKIYYL